ncbi:hypothetical protein CVT25_013629 [Psilocybe cyanescens]|uniref:Uncharacterized protein n=1 Tax=Psilocybe cyanescens TaxID=93625 RepID=A0A409W5J8_PSICY|nr:hypothetical protein CVT25_013629 [Psilocybe cyanescens]
MSSRIQIPPKFRATTSRWNIDRSFRHSRASFRTRRRRLCARRRRTNGRNMGYRRRRTRRRNGRGAFARRGLVPVQVQVVRVTVRPRRNAGQMPEISGSARSSIEWYPKATRIHITPSDSFLYLYPSLWIEWPLARK